MPTINKSPDFSLVDTEVLMDFNKRTVVDVTGLSWVDAGHTAIKCGVLFQELEPLGYVPFSTENGADTAHGRLVWAKANAGDYGPIAEFIPPTIEEIRSNLPLLTPRQFWRAAYSFDITKSQVLSDIALIPDPSERAVAMIELEEATYFTRLHPLVQSFSASYEITPEQLDDMWVWAASTE